MKTSFLSLSLEFRSIQIQIVRVVELKMARKRNSLLVFLIFFEILQSVYSENNSFNPFTPQLNKKSNLQNFELTTDKIFEDPSEEKIIEKRRLLFKDKDLNFPTTTEGQFENNEYSARRRTNFSEIENENQISENYQEYNNWENGRNKFAFPLESGNSRNLGEMRSRQSFMERTNLNQAYDWENKNNILEKSQSRWNEEKNFKQFSNPQWDDGVNWNNNARTSAFINENENNAFSDGRNNHDFNRRISITTLNNGNMGSVKDYNNEKMSEMQSAYLGHSSNNYYNRNPHSFWNPNFYKPEKGVIINFNTECPTPRQFNNQLVHKFIFTPKSSVNAQSEDSSFQIPETLISPHRMGSMYYL